MVVLTNMFDLDKKTQVIDCNARKTGKKGYRRKVVLIGNSQSNWTRSWKDEVQSEVGFRTEFNLFRSEKEYLLQVVGKSDHIKFPNKYKVILFSDPSDCMDIALDPENHDLYLSDPVLALFEKVFTSDYLTQDEKTRWDEVLLDSEE